MQRIAESRADELEGAHDRLREQIGGRTVKAKAYPPDILGIYVLLAKRCCAVKYTAIRSEGGLLPYDLLDEILAETAPGQKAPDFGLPKGRRVSDEIQRVWLDAQELWSRFKVGREKLSEKDPHGTTLTRDRWIGPILTDPVRLSYDLHFQPSALVLDGLTFAISHRAGEPRRQSSRSHRRLRH